MQLSHAEHFTAMPSVQSGAVRLNQSLCFSCLVDDATR